MNPSRLLGLMALLPALSLSPAGADTALRDLEYQSSQSQDMQRHQSAQAWGLSIEEWARYETLMQGQRGLWSPNLDPVMTLGIHARTEAERRRYAEMAVAQERARVAGELAFQRAYDDAWRRLYPDETLIDLARLALPTAPLSPPAAFSPGDRLLLFTRTRDCARCDELLPRILQRVAEQRMGLDIYLLDTDPGDDAAVRAWATARNIPPERVHTRQITLNHDRGTAQRLAVRRSAPALLHRSAEGSIHGINLADLP